MRTISSDEVAVVSGGADLKCSAYFGKDTKVGCEGNLSDFMAIGVAAFRYMSTVPFTGPWAVNHVLRIAVR